jgi:hypothetical protein
MLTEQVRSFVPINEIDIIELTRSLGPLSRPARSSWFDNITLTRSLSPLSKPARLVFIKPRRRTDATVRLAEHARSFDTICRSSCLKFPVALEFQWPPVNPFDAKVSATRRPGATAT